MAEWIAIDSLRADPAFLQSWTTLSIPERHQVERALVSASFAMLVFGRSQRASPLIWRVLESKTAGIVELAERTSMLTGIARASVANLVPHSDSPVHAAVSRASARVERNALQLALSHLSPHVPDASRIAFHHPAAYHQLVAIALRTDRSALGFAAACTEAALALDDLLLASCPDVPPMLAQQRSIRQRVEGEAMSHVVAPELAATLYLLALRGRCDLAADLDDTLLFSDQAEVAEPAVLG